MSETEYQLPPAPARPLPGEHGSEKPRSELPARSSGWHGWCSDRILACHSSGWVRYRFGKSARMPVYAGVRQPERGEGAVAQVFREAGSLDRQAGREKRGVPKELCPSEERWGQEP